MSYICPLLWIIGVLNMWFSLLTLEEEWISIWIVQFMCPGQVWSCISCWWVTLLSGMRISTNCINRSRLEPMTWVITHTVSLNVFSLLYNVIKTVLDLIRPVPLKETHPPQYSDQWLTNMRFSMFDSHYFLSSRPIDPYPVDPNKKFGSQ